MESEFIEIVIFQNIYIYISQFKLSEKRDDFGLLKQTCHLINVNSTD
jgi:hypothetical protein